jgi:hypothetical protein
MGPYQEDAVTSPKGPLEGSVKIARGGAFNFIDVNCAVSRRVGYDPSSRQVFLGLRLVMALAEEKPVESDPDRVDQPADKSELLATQSAPVSPPEPNEAKASQISPTTPSAD